MYSGKGDARVTRVGNILRKTSLDEIPQLCNMLVGDMCFVGTRGINRDNQEKYLFFNGCHGSFNFAMRFCARLEKAENSLWKVKMAS